MNAEYSEYDFYNVNRDERFCLGGEGKIILYTFERFKRETIAKAKSGVKITSFVDCFFSHIEQAVDITEYIAPLLEVTDIFLFADRADDITRLGGLVSKVYRISVCDCDELGSEKL